MSLSSGSVRLVCLVSLTLGLATWGCGGEEEAAQGIAATVCQSDADCAAGEWCEVELTLESDVVSGTCEPLEGYTPDPVGGEEVPMDQGNTPDMAQTCTSDLECPRGFECDAGRCVEQGTGTGNTSNAQTPSTSNDTTPMPPGMGADVCQQDQDCAPDSECCDGECVMRGTCGDTSNPGDVCSADSECQPHQECCATGVCQVRGTCDSAGNTGGNGNNGNGNSGNSSAICSQACNQMLTCTNQICSVQVIDLAGCQEICNEDPDAFGAQAVVNATCTDLNAVFCDDPNFPTDVCSCGSSGGSGSDDICQELGWYGDGTCDSFCPQPDPDCGSTGGGSTTGTCGDIFACFETCPDPDVNDVCAQGCYDAASISGQIAYDSLVICYQVWCDGLMDAALDTCLTTNCQSEITSCFSQ